MKHIKKNDLTDTTPEITSWLAYRPSSTIAWLIPLALLIIATLLFYYPSLNYNFQFDDNASIRKYYNIRLGSLRSLFFTHPRWISYWLNATLYNLVEFKPFLYRLVNVLLHTTAGTLVYSVVYALLTRRKERNFFTDHAYSIALLTAGLYLLHPVQTQTISYVIQGQLEGLAGLCLLAQIALFLKFTQGNDAAVFLYRILLYAVTLLSCGTKEIAIVFPLVLLLVDWFFVAQGNWRNFKERKNLHMTLNALVLASYFYLLKPLFFKKLFTLDMDAQNNIGNILTHNPQDKILPFNYCISQFKVILHYIAMYLWPFNICVEYDWKLSKGFFALDCFVPFLVLVSLAYYTAKRLRANNTDIVAFAILWFFIIIAPRSSIIPSTELLADYKTYCASPMILFLLASGIVKCLQLFSSRTAYVRDAYKPFVLQIACWTLLLGVGYTTHQRNTVWRSGLDFWGNIIQNAPEKARAYNNYAVALAELKRFSDAIPFYKKAIQMDKNYPDPWNNLAVSYSMSGQVDLAITAMEQSLKIQKYYPEGYNNLASFFMQKKEYEKAKKMLEIALRLRPTYGKAYLNMWKLHVDQGAPEEAFVYLKKACLEADLDNEAGFKVLANASLQLKKADEAIVAYTKLVQYNPAAPEYLFGLANAFFIGDKFAQAADYYKKTVACTPNNQRAWYNLGETYLKLNNTKLALDAFTKVQSLNPLFINAHLRAATCHAELGHTQKGCEMLSDLLKKVNVHHAERKNIQEALADLQQRA